MTVVMRENATEEGGAWSQDDSFFCITDLSLTYTSVFASIGDSVAPVSQERKRIQTDVCCYTAAVFMHFTSTLSLPSFFCGISRLKQF